MLGSVEGLDIVDVPDTEVCCGFGGLFSIKYHEISARMADDKITNVSNMFETVETNWGQFLKSYLRTYVDEMNNE